MYSVLIAEDEILVRMGLTISVPWEKLDMYVVQDVANGQEALEAWRKHKPDILITDLAMPGLDGLSLIRKIREEDDHVAIVVVTCMEDFEMLHAAMALGVCAYLVKVSMTIEDITKALIKARDLLGTSRKESRKQLTDADKKELLNQYLIGRTITLKEFVDHARQRSWTLPSSMHMTYVCMKDADHLSEVTRRMLEHMCYEYLQPYQPLCFVQEGNGELNVGAVMEADGDSAQIRELIDRYIQYIQTHFSISSRAVVSSEKIHIGKMPDWYEKAKELPARHYLFVHDTIGMDESGRIDVDGLAKLTRKMNMQMLGLDLRAAAAMNALRCVERAVGMPEDVFANEMTKLAEYAELEKVPSLRSGIVHALEKISAALPQAPVARREVERVQQYLEAHLHEKLRLTQVAELAHVNPQYLSSIFKQELKIGYSDYVNLLRVNKAGQLLDDTDMGYPEIAEACGFSDAAYFSRVFKQRTGVTPGQWRRGER